MAALEQLFAPIIAVYSSARNSPDGPVYASASIFCECSPSSDRRYTPTVKLICFAVTFRRHCCRHAVPARRDKGKDCTVNLAQGAIQAICLSVPTTSTLQAFTSHNLFDHRDAFLLHRLEQRVHNVAGVRRQDALLLDDAVKDELNCDAAGHADELGLCGRENVHTRS